MQPTRHRCSAFSLVEVVLAIGIIVVAVIPLLGLISVGLKTNKVSAEELGALTLVSGIYDDLRATQDSNGNPVTKSNRYGLNMPLLQTSTMTDTHLFFTDGTMFTGTSAGALTTAQSQTSETIYSVTLNYIPSGQNSTPTSKQPALVSVHIQWPATSTPNPRQEGTWQGITSFAQ